MFSGDKEFDDEFYPNPKYQTNLASIFSNSTSGDDNPSLTYTPPKQPKRQNKPPVSTSSAPPSSSSSSILCAKTVQAFKLVDGAYQSQGKVGAAVISAKSEDGILYQLLLYRDKKNHLCNAKITREFNFHIQPKNYCTFYDKQNIIWSILFDYPPDMVEFNLQVAKCRWNAEESKSPILIQDLWCPLPSDDVSKTSAAVGDTVELTYTLQTISSTMQEIGESQRVVVEVESSGWKQALVGVHLNSQKVVILQPFMLGDLNPKEVVYNSPVIVKITVLQVSKAIQVPRHAEPPNIENMSIANDVSKPQSAPESTKDESPRSPKTTKAELINRMARMGQALPFKKPIPTPSDSDETEEDHKGPVHRYGKIVPKPRARAQHTVATPSPVEVVGEPSSAVHVPVPPQGPLHWAAGAAPSYMMGSMYQVPQVSSPLEVQPQFNMFLSEVRTTNSELRMGITRLTDKVEVLQTKMEDATTKKPQTEDLTSMIERLVEEEHQVKDQLQQVLSALQNIQLLRHTEEISAPQADRPSSTSTSAIVESCQQCAELHQAHTSLSEKMKKLEEENQFLQISLTAQKDALHNAKMADKDQMSRIETLQRQLSEEQKSVSELNQSLENLQRVKEILVEDLQTANSSIMELQNTLREKQTSIDRLEQALKDSESTKLEEVRRNLQEVLDPKPVIGDHIKKILNTVYRLVKIQFEPQNKYDANFIQSVLAETIKGVTLEYLQNGELSIPDIQPQALASNQVGTSIPVIQPNINATASSEQTKVEETGVQYIHRNERNISDTESQTCVITNSGMTVVASQGSGWATLNAPPICTIVKKEESNLENNSAGPSQKFPFPPHSKIQSEATPGTAESVDESSDDDSKSIISLKLQTVLLHLSQSQSKIPNTPSTSHTHLWNPLLTQPSWNTYHERH